MVVDSKDEELLQRKLGVQQDNLHAGEKVGGIKKLVNDLTVNLEEMEKRGKSKLQSVDVFKLLLQVDEVKKH